MFCLVADVMYGFIGLPQQLHDQFAMHAKFAMRFILATTRLSGRF
jgi:hypothetical protein